MSNDEQLWYAAAEPEARTEPDHAARLMAEEAVEPTARFRIGTVMPESVQAEPRLQAFQPLERADARQQVAAEPLQPFERAVPMEQATARLQPFEQGVPMQQATEPLRPFERGVPMEQATARLQPFEQGVPMQQATEPLRRMDAVQRSAPTGASEGSAGSAASARSAASGGGGSGGGAGTGFQVDPAQYLAAVSPMLAASEQVASVYRSLSAFLPSLEAQNPWGNDESGKKFAEGEKGYLKYSHDTLEVVKGLPEALKGIADGLKAMAEGYRNADENVVSELGGIESTEQLPASPSIPSSPVHLPITPQITQSGRH
ncbi:MULTISPECIES: hypothetical protein [Kitasatospora]|uniref:Uncharacterized protein n=1 Tax=Kitasatospora setae (strain ATCC 33774 / DSM 43861 / JCM 3304 / KCC A-0304 / NBRC 14216 / KM-6054) TaxID=452652 RepID=E4N0X8_KITSK|nr:MULTISPECIES: hypothetical protein [Kitasatospora]BAJ31812.1 hypothetical protein KSE_60440 [Kitasatospora setae KM-6054]